MSVQEYSAARPANPGRGPAPCGDFLIVGTLFVVATPIGNLEDISPRAVATLRAVALIAAEDTRHSQRLLNRFDVATPMVSYHQHNQRERQERLLRALDAGDVALISDAGTPGISDPGVALVAAALDAGHRVSPIPGPSALAAAVSASGLIAGPFLVLGFLPREAGQRQRLLGNAAASGFPFVMFESPNRLRDTLGELERLVGDRDAVLTRELTKVYEEVRKESIAALRQRFAATEPRGEVTLVVAGAERGTAGGEEAAEILAMLRRSGLSASQAAKEAAAITGLPRSTLYQMTMAAGDAGSPRLESEFPLPDENALQDALRKEKGPQR